ncbi:nitronate monooxygenase [Pseudoramibacter porci]|uniref:Probable nitronate monooxygenase n=1 Tax=Pseudoramibacter porci TaxID=2606631 RepID=A0A7X2NFT1_9FIRM|nr:nitronate monooxygenase [Pseudoramibacter porci]MSS19333.1 enoyl-[acyl-carrier-protein] reductase FabK [Pseudoramibacter porci]
MKLISELLHTQYPFIQGGMANIATGAFAAACSNAGGLGLIASGGWDAEKLRAEVRTCKSLTNQPFGLNLMLMNPDADNIAKMAVEEKIPVITTGAGNPGKYMEDWKAAGILVIPVVASVALARRLSGEGADAVVAEGCESGGHIGEVTTMALVPQVVDAVDVPVIAAGGIADGRGVAAALALGAAGCQIGTVLLASEECPIHDNYKKAVLKAKDRSTVVTGRASGAPVRVLRNQMTKAYLKEEQAGADLATLEKFTLGSLRKAVLDGDVKNGSLMSGQIAGLVDEIRPVAEIFDSLYTDAQSVISGLEHIFN